MGDADDAPGGVDDSFWRRDHTYVIAEAGSNHDGDLDVAHELVDVAAAAGADAVKFQTFRAETMYVSDAGPDGDGSVYEAVQEAEMPAEWIPDLAARCRRRGVEFLSSPFDARAVDELVAHVPAFKVASSTLSHHPLLREIAATDKPVIASTGAHELAEVREALEVLRDAGATDVALLHCVSSYPTPLDDVNVRAVARLAREFDVPVGLSDHTTQPATASAAAVALGASVVEKHFTLDSSRPGLDHSFALEPDQLATMVEAIRDTERALGTGTVGVQAAERDWHREARRSIHARRDLEPGATITEADVAVLRPAHREKGLEPKHLDAVVGSVVREPVERDEGLTWAALDVSPPPGEGR